MQKMDAATQWSIFHKYQSFAAEIGFEKETADPKIRKQKSMTYP